MAASGIDPATPPGITATTVRGTDLHLDGDPACMPHVESKRCITGKRLNAGDLGNTGHFGDFSWDLLVGKVSANHIAASTFGIDFLANRMCCVDSQHGFAVVTDTHEWIFDEQSIVSDSYRLGSSMVRVLGLHEPDCGFDSRWEGNYGQTSFGIIPSSTFI